MFCSILYPTSESAGAPLRQVPPDCFPDLNLDQVIQPMLTLYQEYGLEPLFYTPVCNISVLIYRQEVFRELEDPEIGTVIDDFSRTIYNVGRSMQQLRKQRRAAGDDRLCRYTLGQMLNCAEIYCGAISSLLQNHKIEKIRSDGLTGFLSCLREYASTDAYFELERSVTDLRSRFSSLRYSMLIRKGTIKVLPYEGEPDLSSAIEEAFSRFRQSEEPIENRRFREEPYAEHIENAVLSLLAKLYPEAFAALFDFADSHSRFEEESVLQFSREVRFYFAWLDTVRPVRRAGLSVCYPQISASADHLYANRFYDLALAKKRRDKTVTNDFSLTRPEQILMITGPNQGGKTTFARAFGQIHYLASLGVCVPGTAARLFLTDRVLTHFDKTEQLSSYDGKLQDDLKRLKVLQEQMTEHSIVIVNEIFASTTLADAVLLGKTMLCDFIRSGVPCVVVTFADELVEKRPEVVSMMSIVQPFDPDVRTFRIERKPPDGLAYAISIARKHGLTYEQLKERLNESTFDVSGPGFPRGEQSKRIGKDDRG